MKNFKFNKMKLMILSLMSLPITALAADSEENYKIDDIIVSVQQVHGQKSNIGKDEVRIRQPSKAGDILRGIPGIQSGHPTALGQRIKIRSMDDQYSNISIDGARQEGYHFHHSGSYGIDPELLKRVNINVGSNSITYNAGALTGSINFETVDANDLLQDGQLFGGKTKLGYSSNGKELQKSLALYGKAGIVDLLGYFNHRSLKDMKSGKSKGLYENIPNDGHLFDYTLKAKINFSEDQYLKLSTERYRNTAETNQRLNFGMMSGEIQPLKKYEIDRHTHTIGYGFNPKDNDWLNLRLDGYYTEQDSSHMAGVDQDKSPPFHSIVKTKGLKIRNISTFQTGQLDHDVTIGYEYFDSNALYSSPSEKVFNKSVEKTKSSSLYLEDIITLGNLTITPGIRWDHVKYDTPNKTSGRREPLKLEDFNKTYTRFSKALGIKYEFTPALILFANYTELFRGPYGKEIGLGYTPNNKDLKATTGHNIEVGINGQKDGLFTQTDSIGYTVKTFRTEYKNLATILKDRTLHNIPKSRINGAELSLNYKIGNLGTRLSYAHVKNKITKTNELFPVHSEFMPSVGDTFSLGLNYEIPAYNLDIGWNARFVKGMTTTGFDGKGTEVQKAVRKHGYGVNDIYVSWTPRSGALKGFDLTAGIDNLFNKRYADHAYYLNTSKGSDERGRNFKATASYKF